MSTNDDFSSSHVCSQFLLHGPPEDMQQLLARLDLEISVELKGNGAAICAPALIAPPPDFGDAEADILRLIDYLEPHRELIRRHVALGLCMAAFEITMNSPDVAFVLNSETVKGICAFGASLCICAPPRPSAECRLYSLDDVGIRNDRICIDFSLEGENIDPNQITNELAVTPDRVQMRGKAIGAKQIPFPAPIGYWGIEAPSSLAGQSFEKRVLWLLDKLEPKKERINALLVTTGATASLGVVVRAYGVRLFLGHTTLVRLVGLSTGLLLDFYGVYQTARFNSDNEMV